MGHRAIRAPVRIAHNDFTERSAPQRVRDLLPADEAEKRLEKRFGSINIWRPIEGPVETSPLMICEWDSLDDKNMIAAERHYEGRVGGILSLSYNPEQRWYYFPRMERDEVAFRPFIKERKGLRPNGQDAVDDSFVKAGYQFQYFTGCRVDVDLAKRNGLKVVF